MTSDRPLFREPTTQRDGPLGYIEPRVRWFSTSTRPQAVESRATVNAWYTQFPDDDGKFARKLRSGNDLDHVTALDELYIHHLLRQKYADVRYEEGGVGPDFRAYTDGRCAAAVEVVSLFEPKDWQDPQVRYGRIADKLNARVKPSAGYFVHLDTRRADRDPAPNDFARFVRSAIGELPPPEHFLQTPPEQIPYLGTCQF